MKKEINPRETSRRRHSNYGFVADADGNPDQTFEFPEF